ncbi:uncharacterized protein M6B38_117530 [Iris pallida]|uniref:Uncharacterized protein n=1 Tax=Iris pallida TaxID=29817 RepID=A0AAX6HT23_IRIPA|nr:uncharacterized protein M6B38_117530 [Iris pallida]
MKNQEKQQQLLPPPPSRQQQQQQKSRFRFRSKSIVIETRIREMAVRSRLRRLLQARQRPRLPLPRRDLPRLRPLTSPTLQEPGRSGRMVRQLRARHPDLLGVRGPPLLLPRRAGGL